MQLTCKNGKFKFSEDFHNNEGNTQSKLIQLLGLKFNRICK